MYPHVIILLTPMFSSDLWKIQAREIGLSFSELYLRPFIYWNYMWWFPIICKLLEKSRFQFSGSIQ